MEKIFKMLHPETGAVDYAKERSIGIYIKCGWEPQEGFFLPKKEKPKYRYDVVDSDGAYLGTFPSREGARNFKRTLEDYPLEGEVLPYKIVRYQIVNPTHIR